MRVECPSPDDVKDANIRALETSIGHLDEEHREQKRAESFNSWKKAGWK